jgi:hypothetical protein
MSNSSTVTVACALCIGAAREPYLDAAVAAIADAVDVLVVNDNSGATRNENLAVLEGSAFAARGDLRVVRTPFIDFADMRNRAFAAVAALARPVDWMLFLDADEVHGEQIRYIARELLPGLSPATGHVDAYTYHLYGTFRWLTDVARRMCFYRYAPDLRWRNAVHETIEGLRGGALVLPYAYHHYGNVVPPAALARKYGRYFELGNPVPQPPPEDEATIALFLERAADVRPYTASHPAAARATLAALEREFAPTFALIDAGFRARRTLLLRASASLRAANESLRVGLRRIEHPGTFRAATRAR